jgi:hypothetical protein
VIDLALLSVKPARLSKTLREHLPAGVHPSAPRPHGPAGVSVLLLNRDDQRVGSVIATQASHGGVDWLHASISWTDHMPDYDDLVTLKAATFGEDRECYQVFPVAARHVNIHPHCLHLWGRADGHAVLPDFTMGLGSI